MKAALGKPNGFPQKLLPIGGSSLPIPAYKRICAEFGIDPSSDFRYTGATNHGLGSVYTYVSYVGPDKTSLDYQGSN